MTAENIEKDNIDKDNIQEQLNEHFQSVYTVGMCAGLKSVLPLLQKSISDTQSVIENINTYLEENDPHFKEDVEFAKEKFSTLIEELKDENSDNN